MNGYYVIAAVAFALILLWLAGGPDERKRGGGKRYTKATERQFQEAHHTGKMEYRLDDGTRVDDLTPSHAIEYDFAKKWAEAIGQSLHYALLTGKRPGIVLILEKPADVGKVDNVLAIMKNYDLKITVWTVRNLSEKPKLVID